MLPEYCKFYYDRLPKSHRDVYVQMYKGFRARDKVIRIIADKKVVKPKDLPYIFDCVYNDTPSFYYLDAAGMYAYAPTADGYVYTMNYLYKDDQIQDFDKTIRTGLANFKKKYIKEGMTDYEKEMQIHDYLVKTVTYDHRSIQSRDRMQRHGEIFNILGPFLRKKAVCWGIACAFKLLCDYLHIRSFVVIGDAVGEGDAKHAWNIIRLDEKNYHVDVTWDLKEKGDFSSIYEYFNLDDSLMRMDHIWDRSFYPKCKEVTYNYFNRNKLYVRSLEKIPGFVRKTLERGDRYIALKFAGKMPDNTAIKEAIRKGFTEAKVFKAFVLMINSRTHNIYVEVVDSV